MDYVWRMKDIENRYRSVSGLKDRSQYKIFYCPVRPAEILILGINPGGDPNKTCRDGMHRCGNDKSMASSSSSFFENNEHDMLDCSWKENITKELVLPLINNDKECFRRQVVKSNMIFRRSQGVDKIKYHHNGMTESQAYNESRIFVEEIFDIVKPHLIILEGSIFYQFMRAIGSSRAPEVNGESGDSHSWCDVIHRFGEVDYVAQLFAGPASADHIVDRAGVFPPCGGTAFYGEREVRGESQATLGRARNAGAGQAGKTWGHGKAGPAQDVFDWPIGGAAGHLDAPTCRRIGG